MLNTFLGDFQPLTKVTWQHIVKEKKNQSCLFREVLPSFIAPTLNHSQCFQKYISICAPCSWSESSPSTDTTPSLFSTLHLLSPFSLLYHRQTTSALPFSSAHMRNRMILQEMDSNFVFFNIRHKAIRGLEWIQAKNREGWITDSSL